MQKIQTILARALVRLAIWAAPADMAGKLRQVIAPTDKPNGPLGGGGGPKPTR